MYVDTMHTKAIHAADATGLPMTVYRIGNDWHHTNADWARAQLRFNDKRVVQIVTWLPRRFFD